MVVRRRPLPPALTGAGNPPGGTIFPPLPPLPLLMSIPDTLRSWRVGCTTAADMATTPHFLFPLCSPSSTLVLDLGLALPTTATSAVVGRLQGAGLSALAPDPPSPGVHRRSPSLDASLSHLSRRRCRPYVLPGAGLSALVPSLPTPDAHRLHVFGYLPPLEPPPMQALRRYLCLRVRAWATRLPVDSVFWYTKHVHYTLVLT
jgi:hypothetical protein